jgi:hypothetical protein
MHSYTPILQIKEGELKALGNLLPVDKPKMIPLIQLLPDLATTRKGNYVAERMKPLGEGWSFLDNRLYVDPVFVGDDYPEVMRLFFNEIKQNHINIIPVVRPDSSDLIKNFAKDYLLYGICIRISSNNVSADIINNTLANYQSLFSLNDNEIDLLIDFGVVTSDNETHFYNSFENVYSKIHKVKSIRKLIISAGSFPGELGKLAKDSITKIPRTEWSLWGRIKKFTENATNLVYSDYGNVHPIYNPDNAKHRGTCSIKYTDTDGFIIFKGEQASKSPISTGQYREKSKVLVTMSCYSGNMFSWGDQYILDCAEGKENHGGSTTWVKITQNHHFVKMLRLLES